jgi:hypothetical protein
MYGMVDRGEAKLGEPNGTLRCGSGADGSNVRAAEEVQPRDIVTGPG